MNSSHIVIDARLLIPRMHGIGRVVRGLVREFAARGLQERFTLLTNDEAHLASLGLPGNFTLAPVRARPYSLREHAEVPALLKRLRPDLVHVPCLAAPLALDFPTILTVHDLIPFIFRRPWDIRPLLYLEGVLKRTARGCRAVIADSRHSKNDVVRMLGVPAEKVRVIYPGLPPRAQAAPPGNDAPAGQYLFCLSNPKPAKNLAGLVRLFAHFQQQHPCDMDLVIASPPSQEIARLAAASPAAPKIRLMGYLTDGELESLFRGCVAFVFPSLYEGFGLPPLEAMARGVPVLSSNRASLPEVVGGGGLLYDPESPDDFTEKLSRLVDDGALRRELVEKGVAQSALFTEEKCADETLALYREVMGEVQIP